MVVYIQRVFANYRLACYNKISQKVSFQILHSNKCNGIKTAHTFYSRTIPSFKFGRSETNILLFSLLTLIRLNPKVIIYEFAIGIFSLPIILLYSKLFGKKFILYSHGYNRKRGFHPERSILDQYRLWLINQADALIVYSENDKSLLSSYVPKEKVFVALNTIDTGSLLLLRDKLRIQGREKVREELGWNNKEKHIVYVGRLYKAKLVDWLIKTVSQLGKGNLQVKLHIVGDGDEKESLRSLSVDLNLKDYVKFYGTINDDNILGKILFASDLMAMPGAVGLSINKAFSFDLPVITLASINNFPGHGPEIEYIHHKKTGIIVKELNVEALSAAILEYLFDLNLQNSMRHNVSIKVENDLSLDNMVNGILASIDYVKNKDQKLLSVKIHG
jgi:glycosyltransferase involved in cell wall biosynthesis